MNKYIIPEMDIAYFEKENIVIDNSTASPTNTGIAAFANSEAVTLKSVKLNDVLSWSGEADLINQ